MSWLLSAIVAWYRDEDDTEERQAIQRDLVAAEEKRRYATHVEPERFNTTQLQTCFYIVVERSRWNATGRYQESPHGTRLFSEFPMQYVANETFASEINAAVVTPRGNGVDCRVQHPTVAPTNYLQNGQIRSTTHSVFLVFMPDCPLDELYSMSAEHVQAIVARRNAVAYESGKFVVYSSDDGVPIVRLARPIDKNSDFCTEIDFTLPAETLILSPLKPRLNVAKRTKAVVVERMRAVGCRAQPEKILFE